MDINELKELKPALDRYVRRFDKCIKTKPSRTHLRTYLRGQLGPLERKSIEPMALDAGVPPRTLQEFLSIHRWDQKVVAKRHREIVALEHPDENSIGVVDETSFAKKGEDTVGVKPQYCGATGKVDNCVVSVHLGYVAGDFHALVDGDLYLPEEWAEDTQRRRKAEVPEEVVYRPKWQIALDLLERSMGDGLHFKWLTGDESYGRVAAFRSGVAKAGIRYVLEVPSSLKGWIQRPGVKLVGSLTARGQPRQKARLEHGAPRSREVSDIAERARSKWRLYRIKDSEKGPVVWRVREWRFLVNDNGVPGEEVRLIVAKDVLTGEVKYFLSNAPAEVELKEVLCVAFSRWHVEKLFEEGKGEVGFDHFEVRKYRSLQRHMILTMLSLYFLAEQTLRLRGKKSAVVDLSGEGSGADAARPAAVDARAESSSAEGRQEDRLLAAKQSASKRGRRQGATKAAA